MTALLLPLTLLVSGVALWRASATCAPSAPTGAGAGLSIRDAERPVEAASDLQRLQLGAESPAEPETFVCQGENGEVLDDAVRDGITIVVRESTGAPCAFMGIEAVKWMRSEWRSATVTYADIGRTDAEGSFATTVRDVHRLIGVIVHHGEFGDLYYSQPMVPMPHAPRRTLVVVPRFAPVRVKLCDLDGIALGAGAIIGGRATQQDSSQVLDAGRVHAATDAQGWATLSLPVGECLLGAHSEDHVLRGQTSRVQVPEEGATFTLVALLDERMILVDIDVLAPTQEQIRVLPSRFDDCTSPSAVPPTALLMMTRAFSYEVVQVSPTHFTAMVDPLPWRLQVEAADCQSVDLRIPAGQRSVRVELQKAPPKPVARVVGVVFDPDGKAAAHASVFLHTIANMNSVAAETGEDGTFTLDSAPGERACLSASRGLMTSEFVGPIELTPGEHRLTLQMGAEACIQGRVVDAAGRPVGSCVRVHRAAGALRSLGDGVPEFVCSREDVTMHGDGTFTCACCGSGEYEVLALPKDGGWPARVRVRPGEPVTLVVGEGVDDLAMLRVNVIDAETALQLPGAGVSTGGAIDEPRRDETSGLFSAFARAGAVEVTAWARDHVSARVRLQTNGWRTVTQIIPLVPCCVRYVRIFDADGLPASETVVRVIDATGQELLLLDKDGRPEHRGRTGSNGVLHLRGLPSGPLRLRAAIGDAEQDFDVPSDAGRDRVFDLHWRR